MLLSSSVVAAPAAPVPTAAAVAGSPGSSIRAEDLRVATIAYRLALSGLRYCPTSYPATGLLLHHLAEYDVADRGKMIEDRQLDQGPGILAVVAGSPAAQADLRAGDVILKVNSRSLASPLHAAAMPDRKAWRRAIEASEAQIEAELQSGPAMLTLLREDSRIERRLAPLPGCSARIRLARSKQTNAFATGRYVIVTTALLDFIRDDDELAVAIGHELAHNILGHQDALDAQGVPRGYLRGIGKNAARVRATEEEADRLGIRFAWAAGYDTDAAIPFWRRFYKKFDTAPQLFRTHPSLGARERLITETLAELRQSSPKRSPFQPELRK